MGRSSCETRREHGRARLNAALTLASNRPATIRHPLPEPTNRVRRVPALASLLFALFGANASAAVVELHTNAGFDRDVAGATLTGAPIGGSLGWSATDLTGDVGSGSLVLTGPPGRYRVKLCLHPLQAFGFTRQTWDFSTRVQGSAPAVVQLEGIFELAGDQGSDLACEGPWLAYLVHAGVSTVQQPVHLRRAIVADATPLLQVLLTVDKADAGPLLVDDWSVRADTDVIFREDDQPATGFSL